MSKAGAKWDKKLLLATSMTVRVHNGFKVISSDGETVGWTAVACAHGE